MSTEQTGIEGINDFLKTLPEQQLRRLYETPSNCLAVFRLIPPYARYLVLVLLWLEEALTVAQLEVLHRKAEGKRQLDAAISALQDLHIASVDAHSAELDPSFKEHFRRALTGGGSHQSFGVPAKATDPSIDISFLDAYASTQWETILHFLVGSDMQTRPSDTVLALLAKSGLMYREGTKSRSYNGTITSRGFQFLLQDVNRQLWDLILEYLKSAEEKELDLVEVLGFIFMLGSLELGQAYSTQNLSETQLQVLADLSDYGLIYRRTSTSGRYYPTRSITTLTSSAAPLLLSSQENVEKGFLIIETNYRVYAYTSNPLQIAILNLFLTLKARFPNIVIGSLTRESIKAALRMGITAEQIITFLSTHAHPQMRKQDPLLPPTVTDQIRLWELEKKRVLDASGYLYEDFRAAADFNLVKDYAQQLGVVLWTADPDATPPNCWKLFVTEDGHLLVKDFIKRRTTTPGSRLDSVELSKGMILPLVSQPRLRPHRDWANSLNLNFPRKEMTFTDIPSSKPAALVRLPPVASAILAANRQKDRAAAQQAYKSTATTDDDHLSEADSSVPPHSGLSASTSTLGTVETAETELTPPSSALEHSAPAQDKAAASKKKAKQLAADKRKRRREKDRLVKQALVASTNGVQTKPDDTEDDGRAEALAKFRRRADSTSTDASSVAADVTVSLPQASTSKLVDRVPVAVWADELPDDAGPIQVLDFAKPEPSSTKPTSDAPVPARNGKAWSHDDRSAFPSRRGSRTSLHSANLSRRPSYASQDDRFSDLNRAHSPASSSGGWQEVQARAIKKPALPLRPGNAFVKRAISKEPMWSHDKFDEQRSFEMDGKFRQHSRPTTLELIARPPEPPWTARSPIPYLFNEPGSRFIIDERTGHRKLTLRISLRPITDLALIPNKRLARQRAGVVEIDCWLRVETPSSAVPPPLSEDVSIVVKLDCRATAASVWSPAGQRKRERETALRLPAETPLPPVQPGKEREEAQQEAATPQAVVTPAEAAPVEAAAAPSTEGDGFQPASAPQEPAKAEQTSTPPPPIDPMAAASAQLRSVVMTPSEEHSSAHIPSVEQQMAAQDHQLHQHLPPGPDEGYYQPEGFPPHQFPIFHEPFIGMDGYTYYFDPSTGQSVIGPPLPFNPGYPMDLPPPPAGPIPFFQPRRSHKLEIKAPTPESLAELRNKAKINKHRQTTSSSSRSGLYPVDEPPPEMFIPGSFEVGGSVYFTPSPAFPAPFYHANGISDPAILAMGPGTPDGMPAMASPSMS